MLWSTPAVRAALAALVASALVAAAGGWLHVEALEATGRAAARDAFDARLDLAATALRRAAIDRNTLLVAFGTSTGAPDAMPPGEALALVDAEGRLVATSRAAVTQGVPWHSALRETADGTEAQTVLRRGAPVWVAARSLGPSGYRLAAVRPPYAIPNDVVATTLGALAALWGVLATVIVLGGYLAGPATTARLTALGQHLSDPRVDPDAQLSTATERLGPLATAFEPASRRLSQLSGAVAGAREHVGALYQVNPHYVLLCTMDGRIVEANPAFYAVTGLAPEVLRGGPVEALAETFPVEPLMELAERSLREGASIGGIEYALQDREDSGRPVEVSLRAFRQGDAVLVLIQATDVAVRRTLERRVAAFSDTLDLMVDQRVQQLAAGQQSLRRVLDAAGVVVASFDRGGATRRWSGAAQALSGRVAAAVPHFAAAVASLGLADADRAAFARWFWGEAPEPFTATHVAADGRRCLLVWHRVDAERSGSADHRTVVGVEVPPEALGTSALAAEALREASGDGAIGAPV